MVGERACYFHKNLKIRLYFVLAYATFVPQLLPNHTDSLQGISARNSHNVHAGPSYQNSEGHR
jgi:hypothetical protein